MDINLVDMNRAQARKKFREYRAAVRARHNEEDEALMLGYRALARGHQVLHLGQVMKEAGTEYESGLWRPKLAICRADARRVYFRSHVHNYGGNHLFMSERSADYDKRMSRHRVVIPRDCLRDVGRRIAYKDGSTGIRSIQLETDVPMIPPNLRPAGNLDNYYILWEAKWEGVPEDPLLLKPLSHMLFAVVAQWDLTPLEQAILAGGRLPS